MSVTALTATPPPDQGQEREPACRDHPVSLFFPGLPGYQPRRVKGRADPYEPAKAICRGCPLRQGCLEDALDRNEPWGVWGGMDPWERERERMARRRADGGGEAA